MQAGRALLLELDEAMKRRQDNCSDAPEKDLLNWFTVPLALNH